MGDRKDDKTSSSETHLDDLDSIISSNALDDLEMPLDAADLSLDEQNKEADNFDDLSLNSSLDEETILSTENSGDIFDDLDEMTLDDFIDETEGENKQNTDSDPAVEMPDPESNSHVSSSTIEEGTEEKTELLNTDESEASITDLPTAFPPESAISTDISESEQSSQTAQMPNESESGSESSDKYADSNTDELESELDTYSILDGLDDSFDQAPPDSGTEEAESLDHISDKLPEDTEDALSRLFDDDLPDDDLLDNNLLDDNLLENGFLDDKLDTDIRSNVDSLPEESSIEKKPADVAASQPVETDLDTDQLLDLPLDEIEEKPRTPEKDTAALEKDIESLLDSNREPESSTSTNHNMTSQKEADVSPTPAHQNSNPSAENKQAAATDTKKKFGIDLNMANSITMSLGLIAVLIAALAVWFGLDASQQADKGPEKLQLQIKQMEEQQQQQTTALEQQVETLQQQLNDLTKVVANKATENWQASNDGVTGLNNRIAGSTEKPIAQDGPVKIKVITPKQKPVVLNKATATKTTTKPKAAFEVDPASIKGWVVVLSSMESQQAAIAEARRLRAKDIKAEFARVLLKGKIWFRVRISGFDNEREAVAYQKYLSEFHAISSWHHKP